MKIPAKRNAVNNKLKINKNELALKIVDYVPRMNAGFHIWFYWISVQQSKAKTDSKVEYTR